MERKAAGEKPGDGAAGGPGLPFAGGELPRRAHRAAGRRRLWAEALGTSEAQLAWETADGRLARAAEGRLAGWRAGRDDAGRYLERVFKPDGLGEALLLLHHVCWLRWVTDTPSRFDLRLSSNGRLGIQLRDDELDEVTLDDGLMALVLNTAFGSGRRKRSRLRRFGRWLARRIGAGPARLAEEEFAAGLEARPGWAVIRQRERWVGLQQACVFAGPDAVLLFAGAVLAMLDHLSIDLRGEIGLSESAATVILLSEPRAWPPADLFTVTDFLTELAESAGGEVWSPAEWAEALNEGAGSDVRVTAGGPAPAREAPPQSCPPERTRRREAE